MSQPSLRTDSQTRLMPDISHEQKPLVEGSLDQVGMSAVEMPILFEDSSGRCFLLPAKVDIFVSLDESKAKGIHMSRLYTDLEQRVSEKPLTWSLIQELLHSLVQNQRGLSQSSYLKFAFTLPLKRKALLSESHGYRHYPISFEASMDKGVMQAFVKFEVLYSSTCPCSAALSRQLVQEKFHQDFHGSPIVASNDVQEWLGLESSIVATPHAQRSRAEIKMEVRDPSVGFDLVHYIDRIEKVLATPVQTAVKREDEQEFARLNAANLMFCEDAARKLKKLLDQDMKLVDYLIRVEHQESLHPHNAVATASKGVRLRAE